MTSPSLKIIFAGTPEFAAKHLSALINANYEICAVLTQVDRPSGRGRKIIFDPVKQIAIKNHLQIFQPKTLRDAEIQTILQKLKADIMVDVAYGLIIPKEVLETPLLGCINIHPSLLPRWRGAAPIQHAILAGDRETGITVMQVDEGLDTGPILLQEKCDIQEIDTTSDLHDRLVKLGVETLLKYLELLSAGQSKPKKQDETKSCYAHKIEKSDAKINWEKSAIELDRQIRAYNPKPVSYFELNAEIIRIWKAMPLSEEHEGKPGEIIRINRDSIDVKTGQGILRLQQLQFSGGKVLSVEDILKSKKEFFKQQ